MISTLVAEPAEPDRRLDGSSVQVGGRIRISRPPRLDPPYDDERVSATLPETRTLPEMKRHTVVPRSKGGVPATPDAIQPVLHDRETGGAGRAAVAYVRLCVEVLNGYRASSHLRRIGGPVEFGDVIEQIRRRHNAIGNFQVSGRPLSLSGGPLNVAQPSNKARRNPNPSAYARPSGRNVVEAPATRIDNAGPAAFGLTRLRVSEPSDGVAEAVAVLTRAGTSLAVALRLERRSGTWTCVLVQVI